MNKEIRFLAQQLLHAGLSPLSERDQRIIARIAKRVHSGRDLTELFDTPHTTGERIADKVAIIGGSWGFIIGFGLFLVFWTTLNTILLSKAAFDPYPFIFLNLILSMLAAVQAPIIMMSQNRLSAKDRLAAALDYEVNLNAEVAIGELHRKLDDLARAITPAKPVSCQH